MAMDREEKIGLGAAVGGHGLLVIGMALGLFMATDRIVEPPPMTVTIVGEEAPGPMPAAAVMSESAEPSVEPEAMTEAEAKPVDNSAELAAAKELIQKRAADEALAKARTEKAAAEAQSAARAAEQAKLAAAKANATALEKARAKEAAARADKARRNAAAELQRQKQQADAKAKAIAEAKRKAAAEAARRKAAAEAKAKRDRALAEAVANAGNSGSLTSSQVATAVNVSLRAEIEPLFRRCAPSGVDVSELLTLVTLKIGKDKRLTDVVFNSQSGVNDSNRPQAPLHKKCAMDAARAASPYLNLPDEGYSQWASWQMKFKTR